MENWKQTWRERKTLLSVVSLFIITLVIWLSTPFGENTQLKVYFLDVGQGDATFIEAPNGNQMLIDGGPGRAVLSELGGVMPFYDRHINVVLATHPDADHIGGLVHVLENYDVDIYLETGVESETAVYQELESLLDELKIRRVNAHRGVRVTLDSRANVLLTILFPDRPLSSADANTSSVVAQLVYGDSEFLFTGDAPKGVEDYLVDLDGTLLDSDVLKVGHHGSRTSTLDEFLEVVTPNFAIISSGEENRYGHPHEEVLDKLEQFTLDILRTDTRGRIEIISDGEFLSVKE